MAVTYASLFILIPKLAGLSQEKLRLWLLSLFSAHSVSAAGGGPPDGIDILCSIFNFHCQFPFADSTLETTVTPAVGVADFIRAVGLLTLHPPLSHAPSLTGPARHGRSGSCTPELSLDFISQRGKDAGDYRRRLFRCLAQRDPHPAHSPVLIAVPRMIVQPTPSDEQIDDLDWDPAEGQVCYMDEEDERSVDIIDLLSETLPKERPRGAPHRDAFNIALPSLPRPQLGLHQLRVDIKTLSNLLELLIPLVAPGDESPRSWDALRGRIRGKRAAPGTAYLTWKEFDDILAPESCTVSLLLSYTGSSFTGTNPLRRPLSRKRWMRFFRA